MRLHCLSALAVCLFATALGWQWPTGTMSPSQRVFAAAGGETGDLDARLASALAAAGFTGAVEKTLDGRLGRPLDPALVDLGRLLFFDNVLGLHEDNSCAGCHTPAFAFGDSQSIAIGVQNNGIVGPERNGPRNQRKAPPVINSAFFPRLMLNGRFVANSGDPFSNALGFKFPSPEGDALKFAAGSPDFPTLLSAQGIIPQTELVEMAGFSGAATSPFFKASSHLQQFDDGLGTRLPNDTNDTDFSDPGFLNEEIRETVTGKLQRIAEYEQRFADAFNNGDTIGFRITAPMMGRALAEFQTSLTFADAPIDRFARGERGAMTDAQKRGALVFFGKANCVQCHGVTGRSNEMFSDFENHVLGVPQIAPSFGVGAGNVVFDGAGADEDFGTEQITGSSADRYKFRTSPLRNVALQPAFFHNGAFTRLEDAIAHHLDVVRSARTYNPVAAGVDPDLAQRTGPIDPVLERVDSLVQNRTVLTTREFGDLLAFVRDALLDARAKPENACRLVPAAVPSGIAVAVFQGCR